MPKVVFPVSWTGSGGSANTGDVMLDNATAIEGIASWADAGTIGGATTVEKELLASGGVVIYPHIDSELSAVTGARSQGALISVPAGNFVQGFRVSISTPDKLASDPLGDTIKYGAVFVDGSNVGSASWCGVMAEIGASAYQYAEPTIYKMSTEAGANRWNTASSYTSVVGVVGTISRSYDIWLRRSGTTLTGYIARPGGVPVGIATWTVSTGAGLAGLRFQMWSPSAENDYAVTCTLRCATTNDSLPWAAVAP